MTRHSARAKWNTANARLANKPFDDLFTYDKAPADLAPLFDQLRAAPAEYPMQAARRARFVAEIEAQNNCHDIALNVAAYNVAHVSDRNRAWAEQRLQEEQEKAVKHNE